MPTRTTPTPTRQPDRPGEPAPAGSRLPGPPSPLAPLLAALALASSCSKGSSSETDKERPPEPTPTTAAAVERFDDVTVKVLTFTGPQIAEPLRRRAPEFTRLTGARVEVTVVPFNELYQTMLDDYTAGAATHDLAVFAPQWLVDFAAPGYLLDLGARIAADKAVAWDDIAPFFRDFSATYQGRTLTVPLDGDFQMVYYRSDLLEAATLDPPETWDDYLAVARALHGADHDGDGTPDYGSCISKKPRAQAYWMVWSFVSPLVQSQGTRQGAFFDPDTMEPLVDNPAFKRAIELYRKTGEYGPPDERELDVGDVRELFTAGRCALTLDWGDTGTLAIAEGSRVVDKVGAVVLPGSRQVLDRATGTLVPCDKARCPFAIDGVNHAPYAAFGGWSGGVNAASSPRVARAAFAFLAYLTAPEQSNQDVTIGASGFNPYRKSQFTDRRAWLAAGMSEAAASRYLGAIGVSLSSPNMVLDLRIPHNQRYQQIVLDETMARYLAGELSSAQAIATIARRWNAITDELGRPAQLAAYRASLGLTTE